MEKGTNRWMVAFLVLLFLVLAVGVGFFSYFLGKNKGPVSPTKTSVSVTPTSVLSPIATPTVDETSAIKETVYKKLNTDSTKVTVTVSKQEGTYAKGTIVEVGAVGGGYFIAAKIAGSWVIVYDGQTNPTCTQIAPYNFPVDLVPECINTPGKTVPR